MKRHSMFLAAAMAALALLGPRAQAAEKIRLHLLQGGGHDWKGNFALLTDILDKMGDFEVTASQDLDELTADNIKKYDVLLFYGSGNNFKSPEQEKGLLDWVHNGGAWVGVHSATDSFKQSDGYWEMVGGRFAGHGGGKFTVRIIDHEHPITKGLEDFEVQDETYSHNYHKNMCIRCLDRMDRGKEQQAMAWVSYYGTGRVFYTSNGHGREAWANPAFQRLLVRGIYWAAGREVKDPPQK